jgi:hypothetical protein
MLLMAINELKRCRKYFAKVYSEEGLRGYDQAISIVENLLNSFLDEMARQYDEDTKNGADESLA